MKLPAAKKAKTAKTSAATGKKAGQNAKELESQLDVSDISLDGESDGEVPIYMTCDEVRKGLRALASNDITQAAICRTLTAALPSGYTGKVSAANLRGFMGEKGAVEGNTSVGFYAGYCFLEKRRIKAGKAKSDWRMEMEKVHGAEGVDTKHGPNSFLTLRNDETALYDKHGKLQIIRTGGR